MTRKQSFCLSCGVGIAQQVSGGVELVFFTVPGIGLSFGFVLITQGLSPYHKSLLQVWSWVCQPDLMSSFPAPLMVTDFSLWTAILNVPAEVQNLCYMEGEELQQQSNICCVLTQLPTPPCSCCYWMERLCLCAPYVLHRWNTRLISAVADSPGFFSRPCCLIGAENRAVW